MKKLIGFELAKQHAKKYKDVSCKVPQKEIDYIQKANAGLSQKFFIEPMKPRPIEALPPMPTIVCKESNERLAYRNNAHENLRQPEGFRF